MISAPRKLILEVCGLRKSFGGTEVLKGINFTVEPQELVFIIGPSGAGKSTFLRCLNRLEEPNEGSIFVDGIDLLHRDGISGVQPLSSHDRSR
jgi:polar amino acid transport system ATP-binding protein